MGERKNSVSDLKRSTRALRRWMNRESHFGAVLFSRWLNAIVLQAKPKIAVGFGETSTKLPPLEPDGNVTSVKDLALAVEYIAALTCKCVHYYFFMYIRSSRCLTFPARICMPIMFNFPPNYVVSVLVTWLA